MKIRLLLLLILLSGIYTSVSGQELFIDNTTGQQSLFLGGIRIWKQELKVYENGNIIFKKQDDLTEIRLMDGRAFTDTIFNSKLCFILDGYEPFWNIQITGDSLKVIIPELEIQQHKIEFVSKQSPSFCSMFSNEDGSIYGAINYEPYNSHTDKQCICEYNIPEDEDSLYEAYICINGEVYHGCGYIQTLE